MRELPVYNGAMPQAPQQRFVQVQPAPKVESNGAVIDRAVEVATEAANKVIDLHDFGEGQKAELERRKNANRMGEALRKKMALPYDDPESFYLPDGRLDEDKVNAFVNEWQQLNLNVQSDFWRDRNAMLDAYRRESDNEALGHGVRTALLDHELKIRRQVFEDNLSLASERKDWAGMRRSLDDALRGGQLSKKDYEKRKLQVDEMEYKANQGDYMEQVQNALIAGPEQFAALYDDPSFRKGLSVENQQKLDSLASKFSVDMPTRKVKQVQQRDGSVKLEAEPVQAPRGMPRGLVSVWNEFGGDFDHPDAQEAARPHLLKYLRGIIQHADNPSELEQAKAICKAYGHSADFATAVVKQLRSEIDGAAAFNAREAMKAFSGQGLFFRPKNHKRLEGLRVRFSELSGIKRSEKEEQEYKQLRESIKKWETYDSTEYDRASGSILQKFDQWKMTHPAASYREQARAFYNLVDKHSKEDAAILAVDKLSEDASGIHDRNLLMNKEKRRKDGVELKAEIEVSEAARERHAAEADDAAKKQADEDAAALPTESKLDMTVGVSNGWEGNASESILYVPKGHALAGQVVQISTPNDVCSAAKVVERDSCSAPVLSQMLRRNLGLLKNPYSTLTFDGNQGALSYGSVLENKVDDKMLGGLAAYKRVFVDAATRNGLDPKLLMAIAMHETGRGTSSAFRNKKNAMGVSDAKGPRAFASVEDSIYFMARQLRRNYLDKGLRTVEQIGRKYAPIGAENDPRSLNQHWVGGVTKYMQELNR